jgi:hypothetical protein
LMHKECDLMHKDCAYILLTTYTTLCLAPAVGGEQA